MPSLPPIARSLSSRDAERVLDAGLLFGLDLWSRTARVLVSGMRDGARQTAHGLTGQAAISDTLAGLLRTFTGTTGELASVAPLAAERAVARLRRPEPSDLAAFEPAIAGSVPPARGMSFEVAGKPFLLPARVIDASEGWALYFVKKAAVTPLLGAVDKWMEPLDVGAERTPLMLLGVDYRNSDFGRYPEIVVAVAVTPRGQPTVPFVHYLTIAVSQRFTQEATRTVWGIEKVLAPHLSVAYRAQAVTFEIDPGASGALSIGFPRFGKGRSQDVPVDVVSLRDDGPGHGAKPLWSVVRRSGHGEGMQVGGSVELTLGQPDSGRCLCAGDAAPCLCASLRGLGIEGKPPAANGWTERYSAEFGAPGPLPVSRSETTVGTPN